MEFIDNNDIENFTKDGAILCKGIFSDWVDKLRIGVDKLIATQALGKDHTYQKMELHPFSRFSKLEQNI